MYKVCFQVSTLMISNDIVVNPVISNYQLSVVLHFKNQALELKETHKHKIRHACAPPGIFLIFVMHARAKKLLCTIHFCNLFNVPFNNKQFRIWLFLSVLDMFILLLGV